MVSNWTAGKRIGAYFLRNDQANSFTARGSSSTLINKHVSNHNNLSESAVTTTPSVWKSSVVGSVRMGVNIHTMRVLDQLPFERLCVVDFDDTGENGKQLGKLRGAVTSVSCDNLEALVIGSHGGGLNQAVVLDRLGEFVPLGLVKGAPGVGGGLVVSMPMN